MTALPAAESSLRHLPGERWAFDDAVTRVFVDMLKRSIPLHDEMRKAVFELGSRFVQPGTLIVDLGCSRGDALAPFVDRFGDTNVHVGVDVSGPMLQVARARFDREITSGCVRVYDLDLRHAYPVGQASLTLAILTLQFTPIDHRQRLLRDVYANTAPGGALIVVEKVLGATADITNTMVTLYHAHKARSGYSEEEIERKRMALEGVLVPVTAAWNEQMLKGAGFVGVDCFWRWMNFAGWVAIKGGIE